MTRTGAALVLILLLAGCFTTVGVGTEVVDGLNVGTSIRVDELGGTPSVDVSGNVGVGISTRL